MSIKKSALAVAVLAAVSGASFADSGNESVINQVQGSANTAVVEQMTDAGNINGQFGQVVQFQGDTSSAHVFQGTADTTGTLDSSAPAGIANLPDFSIGGAIAPYAQVQAGGVMANWASILQNNTSSSTAAVYQLDASNDAAALAALSDQITLADGSAVGFDGAGGVSVATTLLDATYVPDAVSGLNSNNVASVVQGADAATLLTRDGSAFINGAATALGGAGTNEAALIIQTGTNHVAQILQSGDGQTAAIFQDHDKNDGYIAQYTMGSDTGGNTAAIIQVASNGISTIYQSGSGNVAVAWQH